MQKGERSELALKEGEQQKGPVGQPLDAERKSLRRAGSLFALSDLLWIAQAGLIALVLGSVLTHVEGSEGETFQHDLGGLLLASGLAIVCIAFIRSGLQYLSSNIARRTAAAIRLRTRSELLCAAMARSPAASFPSSGAFAAQVSEQVDLLGPYYSNFFPQTVRLRLVPLAILLATLSISWLAALILVICGPLIPVFMALIGMKAKTASARQQEELTRLSGLLMDRIRGLETLTVFGALDRTAGEVAAAGESFRKGTMRVLKIAFLSSTVLELFSALGIAFCAVYVGFSLLGTLEAGTWGSPLGYAAGLFVLLLAPEFFAPLRAYAAAYHDRAAGLAAQEKLTRLMNELALPDSGLIAQDRVGVADLLCGDAPAIRFRNVTIVLGGRKVLDRFELGIEAGETVLLEGPSGSGKTTLLDGLLGFYAPEDGRIEIGGMDVAGFSEDIRKNVMWLGQAPRLFHGSLTANLLRAVQDPVNLSEEDLWAALRLAGAETLVERLPNGLATQLGEDGFGLSVGEIRRIALARAALRKDARLFLADEPTAGLDEETASDVIEGLKQLSAGRTTLIATHDPSVLRIMGRRITLDTRREGAPPMEAVS